MMLFLSPGFLRRYREGEIFSDKQEKMAQFKAEYLGCQRCHLRENCTQVVFGEGNVESPLAFVGEGPGGDEDAQGRPFVGKAGKLLDQILTAAEIDREQVYISNVVKCRPQGNRKPDESEMKECLTILAGELLIIRPRIIVLLGSTALQGLIEPGGSIMRRRGHWLEKEGIYFMPTLHPAAMLRNPGLKKDVWEDFKKVRAAYKKITTTSSSNDS